MRNKVRVGARYYYNPVPFDQINQPYGVQNGTLKVGDRVKVTNLHSAPKANVMGMCYIQTLDGKKFLGQVMTNSLQREPVANEPIPAVA